MGGKWVDTNKGDNENPDYRCRLVANRIKRDGRLDLIAAMPPLEPKKMLCARWASMLGMNLDSIDVVRAHFHARAKRRGCVELS